VKTKKKQEELMERLRLNRHKLPDFDPKMVLPELRILHQNHIYNFSVYTTDKKYTNGANMICFSIFSHKGTRIGAYKFASVKQASRFSQHIKKAVSEGRAQARDQEKEDIDDNM
jgi:hypothetical protein